jgi:methyl-accepting chemotaxis protein
MIPHFRLGTKFTSLLLLVFIIGIGVSGAVLSNVLQMRAEAQVVSQGQMLMQSMNSVRDYTNRQIVPLLQANLDREEFVPEAIPAFSARRVFENLHDNKEYADLVYKEAALNPTNLRDKADSFETDLIKHFSHEPSLQELSGFRQLGEKQVFYSARPLVVKKESCLRCHSMPEVAPKGMLTAYGREHGFGWKLNSTIIAQIVYVPAGHVFESAHQALGLILGLFIGIFAIAILLINLLLKPTVLQPIRHLAKIAQRLGATNIKDSDSVQKFDTHKLEKVATRSDELGQLARVFQTMVREVLTREQRLRQQVKALRIEIDEARKAREVAEITDNDYFQQLQQKAKQFREQDTN